ncbi:DUF4179 domain-containing protein [Lachnospiraceae bacterium 29-84]
MKLNHDIYKEAMENVRLTDDVGIELLHRAAQQNKLQETQRRKWKPQAAVAAIACILFISFSINSICYAQTGKNVWEMFTSFYGDSSSDELAPIVQKTEYSGKTFTYRNFEFTLEDYWYDQENASAYYAIRTSTLDHTPITMQFDWEAYAESLGLHLYKDSLPTPEALADTYEGYSFWPRNIYGGSTSSSEPRVSEDGTSVVQYYFNNELYNKSGQPLDNLEIEIYCSYDKDDEVVEDTIGTFHLAPTGKMEARTIDCSSMKYGTDNCKITGAGISLYFDGIFQDLLEHNPDPLDTSRDIPFNKLEIVMSNGDVYRSDYMGYSRDTIPIYDSDGNILNADQMSPEEVERAKKAPNGTHPHAYDIPEHLHLFYGNWTNNNYDEEKNNEWSVFSGTFEDFIDISQIVAVYIDGKEMPLK